MARLYYAVRDGAMHGLRGSGASCGHPGHVVAHQALQAVIVGATQLAARLAHQVEQVSRLFQVHRAGTSHVGHDAQGRDQQRGGDRYLLFRGCIGVFVVQAVLARDKGRSVLQCPVVAPLAGTHQGAHAVGQERIAPAEIVQDGDALRVRTHGHHIAHGFVDGRDGHGIGVDGPIGRVKATTQS